MTPEHWEKFNVFELREIRDLLNEHDRCLWRMNFPPEYLHRRRAKEILKRIEILIAEEEARERV